MVRLSKFLHPLCVFAWLLLWLLVAPPGLSAQQEGAAPSLQSPGRTAPVSRWERVYVGVAACLRCHQDGTGRNQVNAWYLSAHARGYSALSMPQSISIARLSGIDGDVFASPVCMGCHATASDAEKWERDNTFHLEDGVQCERCHGPGSEYMEPAIMADREAAFKAGLRIPGKDFCLNCHEPKGSHQAELKIKPFEFETAMKTIDHKGRGGTAAALSQATAPRLSGPRYAGVMACAQCHEKSQMGSIYSKWRLSGHANAYAALGTENARQMALKAGVEGNPQQAAACLRCHVTGHGEEKGRVLAGFEPLRGVQCESCHGPGTEYMTEAVMRDPSAARGAGMREVSRETCEQCHVGWHGETFEYDRMLPLIDHRKVEAPPSPRAEVEYKTPFNMAITRDGRRLFVACEASDSVIVVDTRKRAVLAEIKVENLPHGICLSPDESTAFVSNRGSDTVSVIDVRSYGVTATIPVGDEPHDLSTDGSGAILYVANTGSHDISVVDLKERRETKRLAGGRGTWGMSRSPDNRFIYATNNLSHFVEFRSPSMSEVTVIDTSQSQVRNRIMIPEANLVQGIDFSPDGEFALVTLLRTKNLVPVVRVLQGWMITNGIGILWKDGRVDQLLLDEFDDYFADPTDVVITAKGRFAYVSGGGVDAVAVIDLQRMKAVLKSAAPQEREAVLPNHLGVPGEYVIKRIEVGRGPRGLVASRDGRFVYVADALDDTVSVIDVARQERVGVIDLGGPEEVTEERTGERIFHSAEITYGRQFSCHSCHPDGGIDGLTYDIEPDGLGVNPVDNRTLRGVLDTAPFKWTGKNPSLARQCGPRLAVFFTRIDPFSPEQVKALEKYICTIPRNPNRYRSGDQLTAAQRRGKRIFERTHTNSGEEIPLADRCDTCHPGPYFTNRRIVDVGTKSQIDTQGAFDVPHLNNIYENAPFLHDGRSDTLEEIWTRFNPQDRHGVTNDMTKDQLNDLIEYLKTL